MIGITVLFWVAKYDIIFFYFLIFLFKNIFLRQRHEKNKIKEPKKIKLKYRYLKYRRRGFEKKSQILPINFGAQNRDRK